MRLFIFFFLVLFFIPLLGRTQSISPLEQDVLHELNRLRTNPQYYQNILENRLSCFKDNFLYLDNGKRLRTQEGAKAVKVAIKAIKKIKLPPLILSSGLSKAANDHMNDTGPKGIRGHVSSTGQTVGDRISRYGRWEVSVGENISYGMKSGEDVILQLLIDDGIKSRGHRKQMLSSLYTQVGIACGPHKAYGTLCVMDFAAKFTDF